MQASQDRKAKAPEPGQRAMIITLDIDGKVISVTNADGKEAERDLKTGQNITFRNLEAQATLAYTKISNPTERKCVTYQTPQGAWTV